MMPDTSGPSSKKTYLALAGLLLFVPAAQAAANDFPADTEAMTLQLARQDQGQDPELQRRLQEWRNLPQDKRENIKQKREMFERLDPAEQQRLREEFRARQSRRDRG